MKKWFDIILLIVVIVLIIPSLVVGIFSAKINTSAKTSPDEEQEESIKIKDKEVYNEGSKEKGPYNEPTIILYNHYDKALVSLPMEEYVRGVVAAEMPSSFEIEALKAQAVAARTLAARKMRANGGSGCTKHKGADVCSEFINCQAWIPESQQKKNWGDNYESNSQKIKRAVEETRGDIMTFEGKAIEVFFYSTSNGKTEDVAEVFSAALPYYKVVDSPGEENAPRYRETKSLTYKEFVKICLAKYPKSNLSASGLEKRIEVISRTDSGRVREVKVGDTNIKGTLFRTLYGLNSADFRFRFDQGNVYIDTIGYGHGVGMSQIGANIMAEENKDYQEILKHYYKGIEIETIK